MATPNKYPPVCMLSDFAHLTPALKTKIDELRHVPEGIGTVSGKTSRTTTATTTASASTTPTSSAAATAAGYKDNNGDGYIDEYDLFVKQYDTNSDKAITKAEFTNPSTGKLYDDQPVHGDRQPVAADLNEDKNGNGVLDAGEDINGNGILDVDDAPATRTGSSTTATATPRSAGTIRMATTAPPGRPTSRRPG